MTPKYFLKKIKDVKLKDFMSFGQLFLALILKNIFKKKYSHCWVVCETPNEARDNGYHFFKYVREKHPEIQCFYAINIKSPDYRKVNRYGNIIKYGSLKHWILYLCADHNISSQKGGKPNTAVCAFLELSNLIDSRFVFLQHGVTINNCAWAHADTTQLDYFVTSTIPETSYIKDTFGFPKEKIVLTGMPRFDNLHNNIVEQNYILVMPTWRSRFTLKSEFQDNDNDFLKSHYKQAWEELLNNEQFNDLVSNKHLKVVFFPHRNMQPFLNSFQVNNESIIIADWKQFDIQAEMKKAAVMITDYSSVFFDMVYMKKPVIFYQFDYDEFRKYDYGEGYFDYKKSKFGCWCESVDDVVNELTNMINMKFKVTDQYVQEYMNTFQYCDSMNSERLVHILKRDKKSDE